jgi:hypothetical protein
MRLFPRVIAEAEVPYAGQVRVLPSEVVHGIS